MPKLFVAHTTLTLRKQHPEWFGAEAAYMPIEAEGSKRDHLVGYTRDGHLAVFVPRWPLLLRGNWASTSVELPPGAWTNVFTGETLSGGRVRVQTLFQRFPVALMIQGAI
jgi:(1->4)-alpha-D-glucan 1-alpha-D-glucosylmutase